MLKKIAYLFACFVLVVNLCGCAVLIGAAAGGAGAAFWLSGKLSVEIDSSYDRAIIAAERALKSLKMEVTKKTKTGEITQLRSEYADGSDVWIDIRPITQKASKVEIRVGITGNEAASNKILDRIKKYI